MEFSQAKQMDLKVMGAITILWNRMRGLPKEDKSDLCELFKELVRAESETEFDAIAITIAEIIEQRPVELRRLV